MQSNANVDPHIIIILQGLIIFFVGADALVRYVAQRSGQPPTFLYRRYLQSLVPWRQPEGVPISQEPASAPPAGPAAEETPT